VNERPYLILCHALPESRASIAACLREIGRVDAAGTFDAVPDLLALAVADCLVVDLPAAPADRALLGRVIAAYPDMHVVAIAGPLPFGDARDVLRLGVHDIVQAPPDPAAVTAAVRDGLAQRRATGSAGLRGMIIAVASGKGGAGCTAVALHLTAALARHGMAAVVDADAPPFGGTAVAADLEVGSTIAGVVRQHLPVDSKVLRRVGLPHAAGFTTFALWAAPGDPGEMSDAIPAALDALAAGLPFVVVDLGRPVLPAQRLLSRRAAVAVIVATLDLPGLRGLRAALDLLASEGVPRMLPVLNRYGQPSAYTVAQAEAALGTPFAAVLPETPRMNSCVDDGTLVGAGAPDDPWWRAVEHLAAQIADRRREDFRNTLARPERSPV
jgi:Flp pilus assembly CpaE family ATPase